MRFNLIILAFCALILVAHCSPAPPTDADDDADFEAKPRQNPPPTTHTLPFSNIFSSVLSAFTSMVSAAGSTANSAFGSLTNSTYSMAEQFINNTVESVNNGINSMANTFGGSNNASTQLVTPPAKYLQDDFLYKIVDYKPSDEFDPIELD